MSTGRRRELGSDLRHLREHRGVNGTEMASRLQWTSTMLSRAETGKRPMTEVEVATYTGVCGVTGAEQNVLLDLAREPDDYRLKRHLGQLPDQLRSLIFHESTASTIESFEPIFIPGITQTEGYARALFVEGRLLDPADIDRLVDIRLARRDVITRYNPAQCTLFVHENALRMPVGGPRVMHEQLLHLLFVSDRPQCSIRVVPVSAGARGVAPGAFITFGYGEDSPVVYLEHQTTSEFLENRTELLAYRTVLDRLATVALTERESREFITWTASGYERQGAADYEDGTGSSGELAEE